MAKECDTPSDRTLTRRDFFRRLTDATFPAAGGAGGDDFPDFENHLTCDMGDLPGQEPPSPLVVMYMDRYRRTRSVVITKYTEHVLRKLLGRVKREVNARNRSAAAACLPAHLPDCLPLPAADGGRSDGSDKIPTPR